MNLKFLAYFLLLGCVLIMSSNTSCALAFHELMTTKDAVDFADFTFFSVGKAVATEDSYPMAAPLVGHNVVLTLKKDYLGFPFHPTTIEFDDRLYVVTEIRSIPGEDLQLCWLNQSVENIDPIPLCRNSNEDRTKEDSQQKPPMMVVSFGPTCDLDTRVITHDHQKKGGTTTVEQVTQNFIYTLFKEPIHNAREERLLPVTAAECTLLLEDAGAVLLDSDGKGGFIMIGIGTNTDAGVLVGLVDQPYYGHQSTYILISSIAKKIELLLDAVVALQRSVEYRPPTYNCIVQ